MKSDNTHKAIEIRFDLPDDIDSDALGHICYQVSEGIRRAAECHRYKQPIFLAKCLPGPDHGLRPRLGHLRIVRAQGTLLAPPMDKSKHIGPMPDAGSEEEA